MRNSRSQKTSDKMAAYRANAARGGGRPVRNQMPTRTSPRKKASGRDTVMDTSTVLSPTRSRLEPFASTRQASRRKVGTDQVPAEETTRNKRIEDLDSIPETPPRVVASGHKRHTRESPAGKGVNDGSNNESEKPSKKRKTFTTPPRSHESAHASRSRENATTGHPCSTVNNLAARLPGSSNSDGTIPGDQTFSELDSVAGSRTKQYLVTPRRDSERNMAERSARESEILDVLSVSSTTVSRMFEGFNKKLISELSKMQQESIIEMRKMAESINSSISSEMRHFEGLFSMLHRGAGGTRGAKASSNTSLNEWETKLNSLTTDTDVVFNKEILGWMLAYNSPNTAYWVFQNHGEVDVEKASMSAQTLLFSLQPGDKKYSYSGTVGTLLSEYKFTVVRNAFYNMYWDSFSMFMKPVPEQGKDKIEATKNHDLMHYHSVEDSAASRRTGEARSMVTGQRKIKRPSWLENKVTLDHINEARSFLERPNQSRKKKVRQTPTPYDIVCHGALRVYRFLGNYLHVRRGVVRNTFFQALGYLLVPWSELCRDVSQNTLHMSWCSNEELSFRVQDIACTEKCAFASGPDVITAADAKNNGLLRSLLFDWPQLVLSVEHTVFVVSGSGAQRKHTGGEPTKIRRLINLVDVACDFCVDFCGVGSRETFLRAHKYALRCVMIFAVLFKGYVDGVLRRRDEMNSSAADDISLEPGRFPQPIEMNVHGLSLKEIIPGPSTQRNLLECRCLRMTQAEYDLYNYTVDGEDGIILDEGLHARESNLVDIEESAEMGIEMI